MLRGLDPILSPDLLYILRAMGHGDDIVVADANFPGTSCTKRLVRLDGIDATRAVEAILSVMPLDSYVDAAAFSMQNAADPEVFPAVVQEFQSVINSTADAPSEIQQIERFAFYEQAKTAFAVVQTGETRHFGNLILKKGVLASTG